MLLLRTVLTLFFLLGWVPADGRANDGNGVPVFSPGDLRIAPELLAQARGHPERGVRLHLYQRVQNSAEEALAMDPDDLHARWWRLAVWGLRIDEESSRGKIRLARAIHDEATWLLARDPSHPGAHHAMGRLHAGILRLNPVLRFLALRMVGEEALRDATWAGAEHHLRTAIRGEPCLLYHRYELARVLEDQGKEEEVGREVALLLKMGDSDPMDPVVRDRALERWGEEADR